MPAENPVKENLPESDSKVALQGYDQIFLLLVLKNHRMHSV